MTVRQCFERTARTLWLVAALGLAYAIGLGVQQASVSATTTEQPDCPTEDSCTVDYRDGAWHIEETTP